MPTMSLRPLPLNSAGSAGADVAANIAPIARSHGRSGGTIDYCGLGAVCLHICGSLRIDHHQSPHLSQPASKAASAIKQATRPAVLRQSAACITPMGSPRTAHTIADL